MRSKIVHPATVIATVALLVALGAPGYAASLIDGARLKARSVAGAKLKDGAVGVRALTPAMRAGILAPCPAGTARVGLGCMEVARRPDASWTVAREACAAAGRRLPSVADLNALRLRTDLAPATSGSEWADTAVTNSDALIVNFANGTNGPAFGAGPFAYRCVEPGRTR